MRQFKNKIGKFWATFNCPPVSKRVFFQTLKIHENEFDCHEMNAKNIFICFCHRGKKQLGNGLSIIAHLGTTVVEKLVVLQMPAMLQVSGVIQLTLMSSIGRIFVLNIKTDAVCIQVASIFTLVQVLDRATYYRVVH